MYIQLLAKATYQVRVRGNHLIVELQSSTESQAAQPADASARRTTASVTLQRVQYQNDDRSDSVILHLSKQPAYSQSSPRTGVSRLLLRDTTVEQAAEQAADSTKRINDMLDDTESAGIEKARDDMLLLVAALEKGVITEQQYVEAASARLKLNDSDKAKESINELDEFTKSAARNMQTSLADFIFDPFANGVDNMAASFGKMLQRMAAEAAAAAIMKNLFGDMGQGTSSGSGSGGNFGWVGQAAQFIGAFFADGGVMTSGGPVPLRKYAGGGIANSPQLAMFGEGSKPEAYVPLPDGRRIPVAMQGGTDRPIVIHVNSSTGDKAEIRRSAAAGARAALGALGGAQRYA